MRRFAALCCCLSLFAVPVRAQRAGDAPQRPELYPGADTNDAEAYGELGANELDRDPRRAASAFYWAARLSPETPEYPYAHLAALLLADAGRLRGYFTGDRRTLHHPDFLALDSLMLRALILDPFLHRWLDDELVTQFIMNDLSRDVRRQRGDPERARISLQYQVSNLLRNTNARLRPVFDQAEGLFPDAVRGWGAQAQLFPLNATLRAERARAYYLAGQPDSARVELVAALRIARRHEADPIRHSYDSKATWEYSLGRILERAGRLDSAGAAYQRALAEDTAFYPARLRLGLLFFAGADTVRALRELARAVRERDDEYLLRLRYGSLLRSTGRLDSAEAHLRRATALEPWAPLPHLLLGLVRRSRGDHEAAAGAFEAFLARAPRTDPGRAEIQDIVDRVRGTGRRP